MSNADEIPTHEELNLRDQIRDAIKIGRFDLVGGLLGQFHQDGGLLTKFGVEVVVCEKPGKRQFGLSSTLFGAFEIARK